jgi:hypothetical protein
MARPMLGLGVAATLAANADFGAAHGAAGIVLSAWPAVAFIGSAEVAFGMVRRSAAAVATAVTVANSEAVTISAAEADLETAIGAATERPAARPRKPGKQSARAAAIVRRHPDVTGAELGRRLSVSERQGRRLLTQVASS